MTTGPRTPFTLGVDPGGRYTGIALLAADRDAAGRRRLVTAGVLTRPAGPLLHPTGLAAWCAQVLEAVAGVLDTAAAMAGVAWVEELEAQRYTPDDVDPVAEAPTVRLATVAELLGAGELVVAVESLTAPKGFAGGQRAPIDPAGVIAAGVILGAVLGVYPCAVVVDPGQNGNGPTDAYPSAIGKGARLGGPSVHARSAYDVAFRARGAAAMAATLHGTPARATRPR